MNIALCISGHLRKYNQLKPNFDLFYKKISEFGNVDIFIATWDRQNTENCFSSSITDTSLIKNKINKKEIKLFYNAKKVKCFNDNFYSSEFSPLNYTNLTDKNLPEDYLIFRNDKVFHGTKMFFLMYHANLLKKKNEYKNNKKYNVVIRTRPDYNYHLDFIQNINFENIEESTIYATTYGYSQFDDRFFYGTSLSLDKFNSCYLKFAYAFNNNIWKGPENILDRCILDFHPNIKHYIIPEAGTLIR